MLSVTEKQKFAFYLILINLKLIIQIWKHECLEPHAIYVNVLFQLLILWNLNTYQVFISNENLVSKLTCTLSVKYRPDFKHLYKNR